MAKTARFNLPRDYHVTVNPLITIGMVSIWWLTLPTLAFFPNALDWLLNDTIGDFIEENRYTLVKLFNVQVWLHMIECILTVQKCRQFGIAPSTTLKWLANVAIHGILALKFLLWPDKSVERIKVH